MNGYEFKAFGQKYTLEYPLQSMTAKDMTDKQESILEHLCEAVGPVVNVLELVAKELNHDVDRAVAACAIKILSTGGNPVAIILMRLGVTP